ncbi:phage N-6-adenine-methyltransferase [Photobacterium atrarenae]|uniref:Phage N-6-adenine-methyltransferase n=1 Tax=Photobacterium atrarenae TaxID=865757 RepID=A0ABY5GI56_9GAMM|nr:phage N-6-adenine-methyltransferase [Photobacterium atrarenae]UTV28973.1 phage N-6-adenine-methyltransferase [Photobacterium atrarenae]
MADYIASDLSPNQKDAWATPDWLYAALNNEFWFRLDACASEHNFKNPCYITEAMDALSMENWKDVWKGYLHLKQRWAWINPPYSRGMIKAFIEKAYEQCVNHQINSVLLVPATPDASWWPKHATEIRFITGGRVSFMNPVTKKVVNGNTKGSVLILFKHSDLGAGQVTRYVDRDRLREIGEAILREREKTDG